jgi:hypothetical protein
MCSVENSPAAVALPAAIAVTADAAAVAVAAMQNCSEPGADCWLMAAAAAAAVAELEPVHQKHHA